MKGRRQLISRNKKAESTYTVVNMGYTYVVTAFYGILFLIVSGFCFVLFCFPVEQKRKFYSLEGSWEKRGSSFEELREVRNSHLEDRKYDWTREIYYVCMNEIMGLIEINSHEFK